MDRYSTIFGTVESGFEMRLAESKGMGKFLKEIGSMDKDGVLRIVNNEIRGIVMLPGYENEDKNLRPVAVRYAPMHLYRRQGMERIRPFCALAVNGLENRKDRVSQYSQTFVFSHAQMQQGADGFNYLDMLFGNELLSWQYLEQCREGKAALNCNASLKKVTPQIMNADLPMVLQIIEAIYGGRNVVIRLEEGYNFNERAMSLLEGIYSLLQPRLAEEIGFATYQDPAGIEKIIATNSIRIFVLPAGALLDRVPASCLVFDLTSQEAPARPQRTSLLECLATWSRIPWTQRQPAMQRLAEDQTDYQNAEVFVRRSGEIFQAIQEVEKWYQDSSDHGTVHDLETLYNIYTAHDTPDVPWFGDLFREKIKYLLAEGSTIKALNASTLADAYCLLEEKNMEACSKAKTLYDFGRKFGEENRDIFNRRTRDHQRAIEKAKYEPIIQRQEKEKLDLIAAHGAEIKQLKTDHAAEMDRTTAGYTDKLEQANIQIRQAQADTQKAKDETVWAVQHEREEADRRVDQVQQEANQAVRKAQDDAAQAVQQAEKEKAEAVQRVEEEKNQAVQQVRDDADKAVQQVKVEAKQWAQQIQRDAARALQRAEEEKNRAVQKAKEDATQAARQERESLQQALAAQQNAAKQAQNRYAEAVRRAEAAEDSVAPLRSENAEIKGKLTEKAESLSRAKAELRKAEQLLIDWKRGNKVTQRMILSGVAGFTAALVLAGGVLAGFAIFGKKEAPVPVLTTPPTTAATVPATTQPTVPTTITTTVTTDPEVTEPLEIAPLAALQLYPTVETENLEQWIPDTMQLAAGDQVTAMVSTTDAASEDFHYALLIQHQQTEEGAETTDAPTASLVLRTAQYDMAVFGQTGMAEAFQTLNALLPEETALSAQLYLGEQTVNLSEMMEGAGWWRGVSYFSAAAPEEWTAETAENGRPVLYIQSHGQWYCVYDCTENEALFRELIAIDSVKQQGDIVRIPVAEELSEENS